MGDAVRGRGLRRLLVLEGVEQVLAPVLLVAVLDDGAQGLGPGHPLLLLLRADVAADVGPRDVLGPPDGLAALLAPAWLPTTRGILQHLGDEGSQLCLGHLVHGDGDAIDGEGGQLRVDLLGGRGVLGQRRLQVLQDGALVLADHVLQGCSTEHFEDRVGFGG